MNRISDAHALCLRIGGRAPTLLLIGGVPLVRCYVRDERLPKLRRMVPPTDPFTDPPSEVIERVERAMEALEAVYSHALNPETPAYEEYP